jgi:MFS family permease
VSLRSRLAHKPPGYQFTIGKILAIYSGLMVALLLAALDQTIVATALPKVVSDLGGITQYSWVFTAYMLGSTVTVPLYGKLGDAHGRKPLFIVAIVIFLVGSALCGAAQNMWQLVVFRAVQGIGAGGLFPLTLALVGMIVPPRDRGRYQGLIGSVFAGASIIGPLVGGFIVDNTTWRWIFYVNLPVGGLALAVIAVTMPRRSTRQQHSIDWVGAAVLATGTTALLLGLVWGGNEYPWGSPEVLTALAAAAVVLAVFALVERRVPEPILPFDLLRNETVAGSVACMALVGAAMFGTISFVPLFVQGVIGTSATSSGVVLTPLIVGARRCSASASPPETRPSRARGRPPARTRPARPMAARPRRPCRASCNGWRRRSPWRLSSGPAVPSRSLLHHVVRVFTHFLARFQGPLSGGVSNRERWTQARANRKEVNAHEQSASPIPRGARDRQYRGRRSGYRQRGEWEVVGELELDDSVTAVAAEQKQPVGQLPAQVGLCR